ncbi:MAG: hypothetical protein NTV70_22535 [Acidobacteria bacterium]|nr:hypothetical protein [Acidobacteriota bacterium]
MLADDLLEQARHLANRERRRPRQASLRRSVSTAYYALFHLLISEATKNWKRPEQRPALARYFDHGKMRSASESKVAELKKVRPRSPLVDHLLLVAETFVDLQEKRHVADYNNAVVWTRSDTLDQVASAEAAFTSWRAVSDQDLAQDYLLSLLGRGR